LKTRDFASDAEVLSLVEAFEAASIPATEFTHVAHIAVAVSYLAKMSREEALKRMRVKVRDCAAHHGVSNLYHETLTVFWMRLLDHVAATYDPHLPLWRRINLITARWGTRAPVDAHYTRELIASKAAREAWIAPDRLPLPF
jgi:hypothetical protein